MIEVSTLTKRYGDKVAADDVSLTVPSARTLVPLTAGAILLTRRDA